MTLLEKIPTVVTVAVLVGIFLALKRHSHSARLQLWMVAWFLIFTHFVAQMLEPATGDVTPYLLAIDLGSLQAAAVAFVVSVSAVAEDKGKRTLMLLITGIPSVTYAILASYDLHARWPYVFCLVTCFVGGHSPSFLGAEVLRIRRFAGAGGVGNRPLGHPGGIARLL